MREFPQVSHPGIVWFAVIIFSCCESRPTVFPGWGREDSPIKTEKSSAMHHQEKPNSILPKKQTFSLTEKQKHHMNDPTGSSMTAYKGNAHHCKYIFRLGLAKGLERTEKRSLMLCRMLLMQTRLLPQGQSGESLGG